MSRPENFLKVILKVKGLSRVRRPNQLSGQLEEFTTDKFNTLPFTSIFTQKQNGVQNQKEFWGIGCLWSVVEFCLFVVIVVWSFLEKYRKII